MTAAADAVEVLRLWPAGPPEVEHWTDLLLAWVDDLDLRGTR